MTDIGVLVLVDYVLDDCFQLISLLFLTVGRNNEAPAVYVDICVDINWDLQLADCSQVLASYYDSGMQLVLPQRSW